MKLHAKAFVGAAIVLCLATSCSQKTQGDQALVTQVQSKLYGDDVTRSAAIKVDAKDGVVTLSGDVPSSDVELEAMKVANGTHGVTRVDDQMKVQAAAATPPPAQPAATPAPVPVSAPVAAPPPAPAPAPAPVRERPIRRAETPAAVPVSTTIPAGQQLQVRMIDGIDTKVNTAGQTFQASLNAPLTNGDRVVVPAGAPVTVLLDTANGAGRIKGRSGASVRATAIGVKGKTYQLSTDDFSEQGKARGKQTAIRTGIGAAAGALIGGLAGGGKGAGIGAAAGGGAGIGYQALTHGDQVKIPSETVLTFRLQAPLTIQ